MIILNFIDPKQISKDQEKKQKVRYLITSARKYGSIYYNGINIDLIIIFVC